MSYPKGICTLAVFLALAVPARAAPISIDFEGIADDTFVRDQFIDVGLRVDGAGQFSGRAYALARYGVLAFGNSPTQVMDAGFRGEPTTLFFVHPDNPDSIRGAITFSILIGDGDVKSETFRVTGRNVTGDIIYGPTLFTTGAGDGVRVSLDAISLGALIGSVEIMLTPTSASGGVTDDLEFELAPLPPGQVEVGLNAACESSTPIEGVLVDLYSTDTVTHVAAGATDAFGNLVLDGVEAGQYSISIVEPIGTTAIIEPSIVQVSSEGITSSSVTLVCLAPVGEPRGIGYWKHQVAAVTSGKGRPDHDGSSLCSLLDAIQARFYQNATNPVTIYQEPIDADCTSKIGELSSLINLVGRQTTLARARQHFMAALLNIAAGYTNLFEIASEDGRTTSQAVTYCDALIDDPHGDHTLAKNIAERLNQGRMIPAGWIPLTTANVAYKSLPATNRNGALRAFVSPNPFNPRTRITVHLASPDPGVMVALYSARGLRIATLHNGPLKQGIHPFIWDGTDDLGRPVASGSYYFRVKGLTASTSGKLALVR